MIIEKNNIDVPEHLNETLFQEIIERMLETRSVKIKRVSFEIATAPGDNYTSQIYRVHMTYNRVSSGDETASVVIKSMPPAEKTENIDILDVYKRETTAYFKVHQLVKDLLPGVRFAPQCYHTFREPFQTLVLEDLKAQNFRTVRRELGLDEPHARMFLEKLGKYHAATMMFCEKNSEIYNEFKTGNFTSRMMDTELMQTYFYAILQDAAKLAETWPGYDNVLKTLKKILSNFKGAVLDAVDPTNDTIKVLNHGDLWTTNIMFQYDNPESSLPKDVVFVDFQIGFIASPGFDLNFFFNTSLQLEVLKTKREELISHYYNSFSATLNQLGCKGIPSESALRNEIHRKEMLGLITLCTATPLIYCDPKYAAVSYDESELRVEREAMFLSPTLVEMLRYSLKRFDEIIA